MQINRQELDLRNMIESYQNKKALLIGNGVNLLDSEQSFSWGALLQSLKTVYGINVDLDNVFKPFPLAFDEMQHLKSGENDLKSKLKNLKQIIRSEIENQLLGKRGFNDYHQKLASLDYDDILTTNYDYSLQKSLYPDFLTIKNKTAQNKQEQKYSLKRCYKLQEFKPLFWHIHGELFDSRSYSNSSSNYPEESIMIGYEHYASYLEKIQENIKGKSGTQKTDNQSLMVRLRDRKFSPFWTDIFFTHNVDIVGLGFDFSENHLWWLVNYRANAIKEQKPKYEVILNNRIRFFYPQINGSEQMNINEINNLDKLIEKKNNLKKTKAIAEVLKAFKVEPMAIFCNSYTDFYDKLTNEYLK
jgi:hypothetical protein